MKKTTELEDQAFINKSVRKPINRMKKGSISKKGLDQKGITVEERSVSSIQTTLNTNKSERIPNEIVTKTEAPTTGSEEKPAGNVSLAKEKGYRTLIGFESQTSKGEFRMVILADRPIKKYESFFLASPPRIVIDLAGKWKNLGYSELTLNGDKVKGIRVGKHFDRLRVVMDLKNRGRIYPDIKQSSRGLDLTIR